MAEDLGGALTVMAEDLGGTLQTKKFKPKSYSIPKFEKKKEKTKTKTKTLLIMGIRQKNLK